MKLHKIALFLIILPLTLALDLILFAVTRSCPSCGSFSQFLTQEGALSFPFIIGLTQWFSQLNAKH